MSGISILSTFQQIRSCLRLLHESSSRNSKLVRKVESAFGVLKLQCGGDHLQSITKVIRTWEVFKTAPDLASKVEYLRLNAHLVKKLRFFLIEADPKKLSKEDLLEKIKAQTDLSYQRLEEELKKLQPTLETKDQKIRKNALEELKAFYLSNRKEDAEQTLRQHCLDSQTKIILPIFEEGFPVLKKITKELFSKIASQEFGENLARSLEECDCSIYNQQGIVRLLLLYALFFSKDQIADLAKELRIEKALYQKLKEESKNLAISETSSFFDSPCFQEGLFADMLNQTVSKSRFYRQTMGSLDMADSNECSLEEKERRVFLILAKEYFSCCLEEDRTMNQFERRFETADKGKKIEILVKMFKKPWMEEKAIELLTSIEKEDIQTLYDFISVFIRYQKYEMISRLYQLVTITNVKFYMLVELLSKKQAWEKCCPFVLHLFTNFEENNLKQFCEFAKENGKLKTIYDHALKENMLEVSERLEPYLDPKERNIFSFEEYLIPPLDF